MFDKIRELLAVENDTVASLESALAQIDVDALREAQSRMAAERQTLLLSGTNEQIIAAEQRLDDARIDVERAQAAREVLETKLVKARSCETEAAFTAAHERVQEARKVWAEKAGRELARIDRAMNAIFDEAEQVAAQIRELHALRQPHQFSGDAIDLMPSVPMPGEEFAAHDSQPAWLARRLRGLPQA